jgi:hypothetical protein
MRLEDPTEFADVAAALDPIERFLALVFLRRYVTWCARRRLFAAMEGAAVLYIATWRRSSERAHNPADRLPPLSRAQRCTRFAATRGQGVNVRQVRQGEQGDSGIPRRDARAGGQGLMQPDESCEAMMRYPGVGGQDGIACICTRECPAACDGECGCEACMRAWIDSGMDVLIGTTWGSTRSACGVLRHATTERRGIMHESRVSNRVARSYVWLAPRARRRGKLSQRSSSLIRPGFLSNQTGPPLASGFARS